MNNNAAVVEEVTEEVKSINDNINEEIIIEQMKICTEEMNEIKNEPEDENFCMKLISCNLNREQMEKLHKYFAFFMSVTMYLCNGMIRASFCWHQDIQLEIDLRGNATQFQMFDLPLVGGILIGTFAYIFVKNSFIIVNTFSTSLICVLSLILSLYKFSMTTILCIKFIMGFGVGLSESMLFNYLNVLTNSTKLKTTILICLLKSTGMVIGLVLQYFFDKDGYGIIFIVMLLISLLLMCNLCLIIPNVNVTTTNVKVRGRILGLLSIFIFFFILQGLFGSNLLFGFDAIITPDDYILFHMIYIYVDIIINIIKYKHFNYKIKPYLVYFCGIMLTVISHCLLEIERIKKVALFILFLTYNVFIENLPEIGLGGLLRNDAEKLRLVISKTVVLCSAIFSKMYSIVSSKTELKNTIPYIIVGIILTHGVCQLLFNRENTNENNN